MPAVSRWSLIVVLLSLFLSGLASIINQSIWQRAIKVYLSGSESLSSMIVVLVFMFGLGMGSLAMGRHVHRLKNPLLFLAYIEAALFVVNLCIIALLNLDVSAGAVFLQQCAHAFGIPLSILYIVGSSFILLIPCLLMGATMPVVSAACQHQLRCESATFLTVLFSLNAMGAAMGSLLSGFILLPYLGQQDTLLWACAANLAAGICAFALSRRTQGLTVALTPVKAIDWFSRPRTEEMLAFWLGFLALLFEMYVFRIAILRYTPLPYTFSSVLCCYLVMWSIGVAIAKYWHAGFNAAALLTVLLFLYVNYVYNDISVSYPIQGYVMFTIPCIGLGILFGLLIRRVGDSWGQDIGRFYGYNTIGSCLGILCGVLLCYKFHHFYYQWIIFIGYFAVYVYYGVQVDRRAGEERQRRPLLIPILCLLVALVSGSDRFNRIINDTEDTYYFGSQGVVRVGRDLQMQWDGLWHSSLSDGTSHVGTNNWLLATIPLCCHAPKKQMRSLVIGLGTGITAATLMRCGNVEHVDVYEINSALKRMLSDYPAGTLHVAANPKVNIQWRDARIGLALNDQEYDLITQQPLYLKQAGSSMLLSKEYMSLIKERLSERGVYCIYSNSMGNEEQVMIVRKTAATVFPYVKSFKNSYMIIASKSPFVFDEHSINEILQSMPEDDRVRKEIEDHNQRKQMSTFLDDERMPWDASPVLVSDDHPLVEYPDIASDLLLRYQQTLQAEQ